MTTLVIRRTIIATILLLVTGFVAVVAHVSDADAARLDPALQKITGYKFGDSRQALTAVEKLISDSSGNTAERLKLEKQFASILTSDDATYDCKDFICRQLWVIGTEESVPALKKLLLDEKLSDMARYALQQNQSPMAGKALRDALKKATGTMRVGIINTLGERRDGVSVDVLIGYIEKFAKMHEGKGGKHGGGEEGDHGDEEAMKVMHEARDTAFAAVNALAKIGGEKAAKALANARYMSCTKVRNAAKDALLLWGDNLRKDD
ncbi:hypothetical protein ACFL47_09250 [Candidatus Latescibacterota bacterium]